MYDDRRVVVIGSGPAGVMAAHPSVRKGTRVTMAGNCRGPIQAMYQICPPAIVTINTRCYLIYCSAIRS
jgi:hypothetical protein